MKVSKEQIVALLAALEAFVAGQYDGQREPMRRRLERIAEGLADSPVATRFIVPDDGQSAPLLEIAVDEARLGRTAFEVCRRLRRGLPPIYVGHGRLDQGILLIHPLHLDDERTAVLANRLQAELPRPG
jgi:L-seryl-tRNA(Ser) seleniumtransferase